MLTRVLLWLVVAVATAACVGTYSEDVRVHVRSSDDIDTTIVLKGTGQFGESVRAEVSPDKLKSEGWTIVDSQSNSDGWSVTATRNGIPVGSAHAGQVVIRQTDSLLDKTFNLDVPIDPMPYSSNGSSSTPGVTVQWTITLPGEVSETNATAQPDKSTVQWTYHLADVQQPHTLHAVSREQRFTNEQIAAASAAIVLVFVGLLVGAVLWVRRRLRRGASAEGTEPSQPTRRPRWQTIGVPLAGVAVLLGVLGLLAGSSQPSTSSSRPGSLNLGLQPAATVAAVPTSAPAAPRPVAPAQWEKMDGCANVGNYFPADAEVVACYSVRICNTGNVRYGVAYAEYEPIWIPPRWYASGWYSVSPGECNVILGNNRWDYGGSAGQSSMAYFAFEYTDSAGHKGAATVTPSESMTALPNNKCLDFGEFTVAFSRCVSKATSTLCVNKQDGFQYNTTGDVAKVACDASRGMVRIPAAFAYHPNIFDPPPLEGDSQGNLVRYLGATFKIGFNASDQVTAW